MSIQLHVRVTPNASRNEIKAISPDLIEIRLRAPAVDGQANRALIEFLAATLNVRPRTVSILRGATARRKVVAVDGLDLTEALRRLAGPGR